MRVRNSVIGDIYFQWKYGFYLIYFIVCIIYIFLLNSLPASVKPQVTAILVYSDPAAMGLFFMGAIILLEKSQRVMNAIAVSPLKHVEYILSKVLSLAVISVLVVAVIGFFVDIENLLIVLLGTIFSSIIFTLLGIIVGTKIVSLNQFMLFSVAIEVFCFVPPIVAIIKKEWFILKLSPFDASRRLIYGSSDSILLDVSINTMLIIVLSFICHKQVKKMFRGMGGVKI